MRGREWDIALVQNSCNAFNESVVLAKKNVHASADKMIGLIKARKQELFEQINSEKGKNQSAFDQNLDGLYAMSESVKQNKDLFVQIASNVNIKSNEISEKLRQLLQMNGVHVPINTCDALDFSFNEESFRNSLISNAIRQLMFS